MEFLQNLMANSGMNDWNTISSMFAFFSIGTYYIDRIICFDKCLKENASIADIRKAKFVLASVSVWAAICFCILSLLLKIGFFGAGILFLIGWGLITIFGHRYLKKVEDPEKKRVHFYGIFIP